MSRRTSEANKAIAIKWECEQQLIREGKGTRNWSLEQQKDIIEKGKAYDENGLAFEGQHMKSVEKYPEFQGNPDNIQFLTKQEHLQAHDGNWKNPSNWYFDPITKQKIEFGLNELVPCKTIKLTESLINVRVRKVAANNHNKEEKIIFDNSLCNDKKQTTYNQATRLNRTKAQTDSKTGSLMKLITNKLRRKVRDFIEDIKKNPQKYIDRGVNILTFVTQTIYENVVSNSISSNVNKKNFNQADIKDINTQNGSNNTLGIIKDNARSYPDNRMSPKPHAVSGYDRTVKGKRYHVEPYYRGKRK